jgi:hypothetical protein
MLDTDEQGAVMPWIRPFRFGAVKRVSMIRASLPVDSIFS